jgi:TPR repeat protein
MLGDRLLVACKNNPRLSVSHIKLVESLENWGKEGCEFRFIENSELLLKSIIFICFPDKCLTVEEEKKKRIDLHRSMQILKILTEEEIQKSLDEIKEIEDPIRRSFLQTKIYRNKIHDTSYDTYSENSNDKTEAEKVTACLILGCLFKFSEELKVKLRGLIVRDFPDDENLESLLINKKEVWQQNVRGFGGREDILGLLLQGFTEDRPYFNLLRGGEGAGKTAVACKFTERVKLQSTSFLGSDAPSVQEKAPWLPGAVLYLGKCPGGLNDFTKCIIAQANTMLLEEISLPVEEVLKTNLANEYDDQDREAKERQLRESQGKQDSAHDADTARLQIGKALKQLFWETGHATIVVDALDELFERRNLLNAIPEELVMGSHCLVSGRGPVIAEFYARRRDINEIQLNNLTCEDIPLVLGLTKEKQENKEFINEVYSRTGGLALAVRNTAENIKKNKGELSIDLIENESELWQKHLRDWEVNDDDEKAVALEKLLPLFLFFECSGLALKNDELQSYLCAQGTKKRLRWLQEALSAVDTQLVGVHTGNAKLQNHGFVEHCLNHTYSTHDLEVELSKILGWMSKSLNLISSHTVASFSSYWYEPSNYLEQTKSKPLFEVLISALTKDADVLKEVIEILKAEDDQSNFVNEVLEAGSDKDITFCQRLLGRDLLSSNFERGEQLMKQAISNGDLKAKSDLGLHLLIQGSNESDENHRAEGKGLLLDAFFDGDRSLGFLSEMLFDGYFGLNSDPENGKKVLEQLTEEGDTESMIKFAERLIEGKGLEKNVYKGEEYFRLACKKNNTRALTLLGFRYIDGKGVEQNIDEGLSLLERAIELGDAQTMFLLGRRKLKGSGVGKDLQGARELLISSCNAKYPRALHYLGMEFINGSDLNQDKAKGIELLNQAIDMKYDLAKVDLGILLIEGKYLGRNDEKGKELLYSVVNDPLTKYDGIRSKAQTFLGCFLIDDEKSSSSVGEALLIKAIEKNYLEAYRELGERLITGTNLERDESKGNLLIALYEEEQTLGRLAADGFNAYTKQSNKAEAASSFLKAFLANSKDFHVGNNLAYMLHRGDVPEDLDCPSIEELLSPGIENDWPFSIINYSLCLAKGYELEKDWRKADQAFEKLVDSGKQDFSWWVDLASKDDADGHLVVAWLVRYGIIPDPENLSIEERLNLAKAKGFDVPSWMNEKAVTALK